MGNSRAPPGSDQTGQRTAAGGLPLKVRGGKARVTAPSRQRRLLYQSRGTFLNQRNQVKQQFPEMLFEVFFHVGTQ